MKVSGYTRKDGIKVKGYTRKKSKTVFLGKHMKYGSKEHRAELKQRLSVYSDSNSPKNQRNATRIKNIMNKMNKKSRKKKR